MSITLFSPAKLNLFFRVLSRRSDGYHEIASLYQAISLGDTLEVALSSGPSDFLSCSDSNLPCNDSNLIIKAANLFRRKTGLDFSLSCKLDKKIPIESGLGGGSSNAATTLWALNALTDHPVSTDELIRWSAELGSDVPFFFSQGTAYCTGRGEVLQEVPPLDGSFLWIAKPKFGLSTPLVYRHCDTTLLPNRDPQEALDAIYDKNPYYFNDLEEPAFRLLPSLATLKQELLKLNFSQVVMTGSGTAFFCVGEVENPSLKEINFYKVEYATRTEGSWYEFPSVCYT